MNLTPHELERLLPLACAWVAEQEQTILQSGVALSSPLIVDAKRVGVLQPERVRVLQVNEFAQPEHPDLAAAGRAFGFFSTSLMGRAFRYGIVIRRDLSGQRALIVHELAHTAQYERLGGIEPFLRRYLHERTTIGYPCPMENEADRLASEVCRPALDALSTRPLRRDPQLHTRPEWDGVCSQGDKCAAQFVGIIKPDDSVELVIVRNCDDARSADHNLYWPGNFQRRWRWTKNDELFFWDGHEADVEQLDRIEQATARRVQSLSAEIKQTHPYTGYSGIPWKSGGAARDGASCTGLVWLWLSEQTDFKPFAPTLPAHVAMEARVMPEFKSTCQRGDVVFFRFRKTGKIQHCAVCIGGNQLLHTVQGCASRVDNGSELLRRAGFDCVGTLTPEQAHAFYLDVYSEHLENQTGSPVEASP